MILYTVLFLQSVVMFFYPLRHGSRTLYPILLHVVLSLSSYLVVCCVQLFFVSQDFCLKFCFSRFRFHWFCCQVSCVHALFSFREDGREDEGGGAGGGHNRETDAMQNNMLLIDVWLMLTATNELRRHRLFSFSVFFYLRGSVS